MLEIREALNTYLKNLHPRVYFQAAPEKAAFPYVIYDLPSTFCDGEATEVITIDIDGWDQNTLADTTTIETLMKTMNGKKDEVTGQPTGFDKATIITADFAIIFYLENKIPIIDPDPTIKHRRYIYMGRLIRRN